MEWIKAHLVIVISIAVMVLALGSLVWPTLSHGSGFTEMLDERADRLDRVERLRGTSVSLPPASPGGERRTFSDVVVNEASVEALEALLSARNEAFSDLLEAAVRFNRAGPNGNNPHELMYDRVFPAPSAQGAAADIARAKTAYRREIDALYDQLGAGVPPSDAQIEDLRQRIPEGVRAQADADGTGDRVARMAVANRAAEIQLYAQPPVVSGQSVSGALDIEPWAGGDSPPALHELWNGQVELWIQQDLVAAINRVNDAAGGENVLTNPVKRLRDVTVLDYIGTASGSAVPTERVRRDYSVSATGRVTTALYDVRPVDLSLVIESRHIPRLLNAITAVNFMTPEIRRITRVDQAEHFAQRYAYGNVDVVQLDLRIETLWLRPWTAGHPSRQQAEQRGERFNAGLMPDAARYERGMEPRAEDFQPPEGMARRDDEGTGPRGRVR